jgi:cystathionine gamma-synthase
VRVESLVVASGRPAQPGGPLNAPIVLAAPYLHDGNMNGYSRDQPTETRAALEVALGELEGGGTALAFASGMAAIAALVDLQPAGTVVVVPEAAYSGAVSIFARAQRLGRLTVRSVDVADTDSVVAALAGAGLLWLETLTNPLLAVPDLPVLIDAAHAAGAQVGVDATFSTPLNVRPLDLGADLVMHSATKYLAGHSDLLMGVLATRSTDLAAALFDARALTGAIPGALESYLALRGLRTLALRWERAQANAVELAGRLEQHPRVARVRYPGLPSDPGHERAARLHAGFGAMIGIEVAGGAQHADQVCQRVRLISHATSLGGVESLIERRALHPIDAGFGTPQSFLRFSVGIEHVEDLWDDLCQALVSG